ncbi:MAG: NPCBM/NEW2 domain-containing protein [Planctomycetes bacterium]|nr:NPCBM/NEW2 domain-containing protein [Planctomycetota bacterium]
MSMLLSCCVTSALLVGAPGETVPLGALELGRMTQGWGEPKVDRSVTGAPLSIAGRRFEHGVGTHARSHLWLELAGGSERFLAFVGVDDDTEPARGTVVFEVLGDGKKLWSSGTLARGAPPLAVDVDVRGVQHLLLRVGDAGDGIDHDHADWADARFVVVGERPRAIDAPREEPVILTPPPARSPRLNTAAAVGCRPGNPFLYRLPTTGERPMRFAAAGLPASLALDPTTGIVRGVAPERGEHAVTLTATNAHGSATRALRIVSGDALALTPPMGWNSWYSHYDRITDELARQAADALLASGMADVGYQYVCLDDCWMNAPAHRDPKRVGPLRDADGELVPNAHFPDMRALTEYVHARGLKAGIYTSPGPRTCAGFAGSFGHEAQDARRFVEWGFDFLKYDWCSYGELTAGDTSLAALQQPYRTMGALLAAERRDVVFNLCQYGMGDVWEWGADVGGHTWRTAGDLGLELDRIFDVALANAEHREWSRPGAWNDPDYIQIGSFGDARTIGEPRPCRLTPNEQHSFMSLWCLMAAPLFFSGDMRALDAFTLNVLCNAEVIELDQDPLGVAARSVVLGDETFAFVKELANGDRAVGLFNHGEFETDVRVVWADLGLDGEWRARDVWRQRDLRTLPTEFSTRLGRHGVALLRLGRPR